ncbi:MAG: hypothetical protein A2X78_04635 [Gammaproteobacteria bacterium GWE2_37_16]|nr:MAG: hypothetical protein A2X78_04635 [Gammaproteobacteria bacterium GWE2_37_16]
MYVYLCVISDKSKQHSKQIQHSNQNHINAQHSNIKNTKSKPQIRAILTAQAKACGYVIMRLWDLLKQQTI